MYGTALSYTAIVSPHEPPQAMEGALWISTSYPTPTMLIRWNDKWMPVAGITGGGGGGATLNIVSRNAGTDMGTVQDTFNQDQIPVSPGDFLVYNYGGYLYAYAGPPGQPVSGATAADFVPMGPASAAPDINIREVNAGPDQGSVSSTFNSDRLDVAGGDLLVYHYNGNSYLYSGPPGTPVTNASNGDFVGLGSTGTPITFATPAEIAAGVATDIAIDPAGLRSATVNRPSATPTLDAGKLVRLNAAGKFDPGFVIVNSSGQIRFATPDEVLAGTAVGAAIDPLGLQTRLTDQSSQNPAQDAGKIVMLDSSGRIPASMVPAAQTGNFLPLDGGDMTEPATITFTVPTAAAPATPPVRIEGNDPAKSAIDGFTIAGAGW